MKVEEVRIRPKDNIGGYFIDLWRYRELFRQLIWRDIHVQYKQALLGLSWSLGRPLIMMLGLTLAFGKLGALPSQGVPYALWVMGPMVVWQAFSDITSDATLSLVRNSNLLTKVYFPRLLLPAARIGVNALDFALVAPILAAMIAMYGFPFRWQALLLPILVLWATVLGLGLALSLASLNVRYRDIGHAVPFALQALLYCTPVGYSVGALPRNYAVLSIFNPLCGLSEAARWCLFGTRTERLGTELVSSLAATILFWVIGLVCFKAVERDFADVI